MKIITSIAEMINLAHTLRSAGQRIGLVPTMGALHRGHLSLVAAAREHADTTVLSIFVNPTQFGPNEDFQKYPRPFEADCEKADAAGCDIVFAPSPLEMYPADYRTTVAVSGITERLCGMSRPTHFSGVTTVVLNFFNIVGPHVAVFGAKDAQQATVIRRMAADLHLPLRIIVAPIVREDDGLALSSRNVYLTATERNDAVLIYRGIRSAEALFAGGERTAAKLVASVHAELAQSLLIAPEYVEIVNRLTLDPVDEVAGSALLAVACRMKESTTRLIDNTVLGGVW